jgi:hypothetical protein
MLFAQLIDAVRDKGATALMQFDVASASVLGGAIITSFTIVAKMFCGYLAERDRAFNEQRKADGEVYTARLQGLVTRLDEVLRDSMKRDANHDAEFRMMYEALLNIHVSTATVMGKMEITLTVLSERIGGLEAKVLHPRGEQPKLADPAGVPRPS